MGRILSACRQLTTAGLLAYYGFLPALAAGALAMLMASPKAAVLLGTLAGLTAGPGLAGLYATARSVLRGRRGSWWKLWRRAALGNMAANCLLGAISVSLLCRWQTTILLAGGVKHASGLLWAVGWGLVVCLNEGWARLAGGAKGKIAPLRSLLAGSLHFFWWAALCVGFPLSYVVALPFGYGLLLAAVLAIRNPSAKKRAKPAREKIQEKMLFAAVETPVVQPASSGKLAKPAESTGEPAGEATEESSEGPTQEPQAADERKPARELSAATGPQPSGRQGTPGGLCPQSQRGQPRSMAALPMKTLPAGHSVHRRKPTGLRKK